MRESVNWRNIDRNFTLNLIVIFNSFTDISFLKYVTKIFYISYYFQDYFWGVLRYSSQWLCLYVSSKGANLLQVLLIRTLGNKLLKLRFSDASPKILFLKGCRNFRIKSEELALKNYVLEYHTAD